MDMPHWIEPHPTGIYVRPADAWIDPSQPAERALVTHGHADHARGGHGHVWATEETLGGLGWIDPGVGGADVDPVRVWFDPMRHVAVEDGCGPLGSARGFTDA